MKTSKILFLLLISISFFNCENKDDISFEPVTLQPTVLELVLNNQPIINNPYDINEYITNPLDLDDEKIQRQLLSLGLEHRDLFKDNTYSSVILSKAKTSASGAMSFSLFLSQINGNLKNGTMSKKVFQNLDLTHTSQNPANKGIVEEYVPAIFVPNVAIADPTLQPIVSSGIAVNSELEGLENYEDHIVAWYYVNGSWVEFLLNEKTVKNMATPVFIVDNAEENMLRRPMEDFIDDGDIVAEGGSGTGGNSGTSTYQNYYSRKYKINHRYESWSRSELYITGAHISQTGTYALYSNGNGPYYVRRQLASVSRHWIGDWRGHYQQHSDGNTNDYTFWNTYERDWWRSYKSLGCATRNGLTICLRGKRKYTNEWYAYDPAQLNNNPLTFNYTYQSEKYFTNSKGGLLISKH